jgi:HEAT repeat protein
LIAGLVDLAEDNVEFDFSAVLRACLSDPDEEIRVRAVDGLWEDEESSTALRLLDLLARDPSPRVRAAAAAGLARFVYRVEMGQLSETTGRKIRAGLLATVDNAAEPIEVRRRAVEAISYLSEPEVREVLRRAYADPDEKMRASAVFGMGRNCDAAWLEVIVQEMKSPIPELRYEAAKAAGELEDERAVRPLVLLLADDDREVRLATIAALGQIGGETAVKALHYVAKEAQAKEAQAAAASGSADETVEGAEGDEELRAAIADALAEATFSDDPIGLHPNA